MLNWIASMVSQQRLSLLIAIAYLLLVGLTAVTKSAREVVGALLITTGFLLLPLACIWFGDELGDYVGALPGPAIRKQTPGWMVRLGGWFLLLLPPVAMWLALGN